MLAPIKRPLVSTAQPSSLAKTTQLSVRCGMGLGDALYLQAVARHLVLNGIRPEVCNNWPEVFIPLADKIVLSPFRRDNIKMIAHYSTRRRAPGTTQFQDCLVQAGIREQVELKIDWVPINQRLIARAVAPGLPVVLVALPRAPMGRKDGFGLELLPNCQVLQSAIDQLRGRATVIQVGAGVPLYHFTGVDIDLANKTSVSDLLDLAWVADGFLGYISFLIPLAESFAKPALLVWARAGLTSTKHEVLRHFSPKKILHRPTSKFVVDDCSTSVLKGAVDALLG